MAYKRKFSRRKSFKRKTRGRFGRGRKTFASRVTRVLMKKAESKYYMSAGENQALYHDRGNPTAGLLTSNQGATIFNPWYNITRGTSISQRIGDEITPSGMALRIMYNAVADRPSQFVRIIVAVIPKTVASVILDGSNYDLLDAGGSNDTVTGMIKKEGVKCLYDKTLRLQNDGQRAVAAEGDSRMYKKLYIKSKRGSKITWQQDGTLANKPVGVWVIPYDRFGTLRSDGLGLLSYTYKLYFKDI